MELIHVVKFLHLLCVVLLVTSVVASFLQKKITVFDISVFFWILGLFATGSVLVLPAHYTFTTPWIVVAMTLLTFWSVVWSGLLVLKHYQFGSKYWYIIYALLVILLVCIMHDAVFRHTLWGA